MFWFEEQPQEGAGGFNPAKVIEEMRHHDGGGAAHHTPPIVEALNHWVGEPLHHFQLKYTKPFWDNYVFSRFGTTAEDVFGAYTPENAIPWYTVMFVIACLLTMLAVWILKGRYLSEDEPHGGQQTLEVAVLSVRGLLYDIVGPHGLRYFPVVATFAMLILISNLMGLFPGLMSPTASTSVTFALGIASFVYYNYVGIKENGLFGHLKHFAGPVVAIAWLMFPIELISNFVRPLSLGMRLFGNIFGDEQVAANIASVGAPYTYWIIPAILMVLSVFASVMQTFIFTLLSMIYIGEVSHPPHDEHGEHAGHGEAHAADDGLIAPVMG